MDDPLRTTVEEEVMENILSGLPPEAPPQGSEVWWTSCEKVYTG